MHFQHPAQQEANAGTSRRRMLQVAGIGALATAAHPLQALAAPQEAGLKLPATPKDANFWRAVRREFILDKRTVFMNVGTNGSPPKSVLETMKQYAEKVSREAISGYGSYDDIRAEVAPDFGARTDEFVISDNTSDGMSKVFAGLDLKPGDEVLTTNHEHSGGESPLAIAKDRHGVEIVRVVLPVGDDQTAEDYVEAFRAKITSRTKLMMFSAPTYLTGTMLPIRELCVLAQEHGITTLVDAAHVPGMMHYDFHELGADFIAAAGAKWQCAPAGSGVLYIRNSVSDANPNPLPKFWPTISSGYTDQGPRGESDPGGYDIGAVMQSCGNRQAVLYQGFLAACRMWNEIGRDRIEEYILGLSTDLKHKIVERWGKEALYSPVTDERLRCALTSFNPFRDPGMVEDKASSDEFVQRLETECGYRIRNTVTPTPDGRTVYGVRVSTHLFHDTADVDGFLEAAWSLAGKMQS